MEIPTLTEVLAALHSLQVEVAFLRDAKAKAEAEKAKAEAEKAKAEAEKAKAEAEKAKAEAETAQLRQLVQRHEESIAALRHRIYGSSSEKGSPEAAEAETKAAGAAPRARKGTGRHNHGRGPIPENLETEEIEVDVEPVMRPGLVKIGEDIREVVVWVKGHWVRRRYHLAKYANPQHPSDGVVCAEMPALGVERGKFDPSVAARLAHGKYVLHLPVNRQCQQFAREGFPLPLQTAVGHLIRASEVLVPLAERILSQLRLRMILHFDDTPVDMLEHDQVDADAPEDPGKRRCRTARIWALFSDSDGPALAGFVATPGRSAADVKTALGALRASYIQADALSSHDFVFAPREDGGPSPKEIACLAHVRRKFKEAEKAAGAKHSAKILKLIARLYAIEEEIRPKYKAAAAASLDEADWQAAANLRRDYRIRKGAGKLLDEVLSEVDTVLASQVPGSLVHKAATYAGNLRVQLKTYLKDGRLEIDNNKAENSLRRVGLGRNNWLFFGSETGAEAAAVWITLAACCGLHQVDFEAYLTDVLPRMVDHDPERLEELLPHNWKPLA
jgi:transposase